MFTSHVVLSPTPIMAQKYMLIPLPQGIFADYDLCTRAVIGALHNRLKLSGYNLIGDDSGRRFYDEKMKDVYCVYTHAELAYQLGVSEKTIRRSLQRLYDDNLVWWYKPNYQSANRYFLHHGIREELKGQ